MLWLECGGSGSSRWNNRLVSGGTEGGVGGRRREKEAAWPCLSVEDEETPGGVKQREEQDILCVIWD